MFTKEIYVQYFTEIHRKEKDMIILLREVLGHVSDDYMRKAISWHMKREIRLAVLVRKLIRDLSSDSLLQQEQDQDNLNSSQFVMETINKETS